ncbi:hypothetical protein [Mammaliicoccus sp. E-M21]|uniref:hypothetical protein n=1 Tax=Mammaliicoccus sp. E-M21 TaxID=2898681 RepID=UPI001EFB389F|nr:hypothetical protein [Mammaliicoccus sp. E-M21]
MGQEIQLKEIGKRFIYEGFLYATYEVNNMGWVVFNCDTQDIVRDENIVALAHEGLML